MQDRHVKRALVVVLGMAAVLLLAGVATAGPPKPLTATVTASTIQPGFMYIAGDNLITRNRVYVGSVSDIDGDHTDETILIIEDSVCKLPCSLAGLEGRNQGSMVVYLSGGKVVEGRFEGQLMDSGSLSGSWEITRVAGPGFLLIHGHGSGTYTGLITGTGTFTLTLTGSADV
jgi:hypothetical protein